MAWPFLVHNRSGDIPYAGKSEEVLCRIHNSHSHSRPSCRTRSMMRGFDQVHRSVSALSAANRFDHRCSRFCCDNPMPQAIHDGTHPSISKLLNDPIVSTERLALDRLVDHTHRLDSMNRHLEVRGHNSCDNGGTFAGLRIDVKSCGFSSHSPQSSPRCPTTRKPVFK